MTDAPNDSVRVRFAPSPTGPLHIGGLRTALFNWLFARHHGGKFILRIEDTDRSRFKEDAVDLILNAMDWLDLDIDEGPREGGEYGPYVQSERSDMYREWAEWLIANDKAYYDYTTSEELKQINEEKAKRKEPPGYDRRHRDINDEERAALKAEGRPEVVRFKAPLTGETVVHDMIRGEVTFDNSTLQDTVLLKSDGFPTYHLANVVDDHFMQITHILRANEWLASAPLHKQLYDAFGWDMPQIAHLPVLLNPNGKGKMSKRNPPKDDKGNVIPVLVTDYAEGGILPDAMFNFLAGIGWSFGDEREVFTREEAIERFSIAAVNPANSAYPHDKLIWMNGKYIRESMSADELTGLLLPILQDAGYTVDTDKLKAITPAIQTRIERLTDVVELLAFLFIDTFEPPAQDDLIQKKMDAEKTLHVLEVSHKTIAGMEDFSPEHQEEVFRALAKEEGFKAGQWFGTLRAATAAQRIAPPLFDSMAVLGKETSLTRIQQAIDVLKNGHDSSN